MTTAIHRILKGTVVATIITSALPTVTYERRLQPTGGRETPAQDGRREPPARLQRRLIEQLAPSAAEAAGRRRSGQLRRGSLRRRASCSAVAPGACWQPAAALTRTTKLRTVRAARSSPWRSPWSRAAAGAGPVPPGGVVDGSASSGKVAQRSVRWRRPRAIFSRQSLRVGDYDPERMAVLVRDWAR